MSRPSVSVIIPTYNRIDYLREALDSVHAQTYTDYEVIVVDDGSEEPIKPQCIDHPARPHVYRQSHLGPAAARNTGLSHASADHVAFLDSDDLWHPAKLDTFMAAVAERTDCNIFYGPMRPIGQNCEPILGRTKPCHGGWITEPLFCSSFVHIPTVVCRKQTLLDAGGFNGSLPVCEDYDLWLRLSVNERFILIEEPLAMRRLHGNRLSKDNMSRNLAVKAQVLQDFYESKSANGHLDPDVARARLARVLFVAGRAALHQGQYQNAIELCRDSRRYGCSAFRAIPLLVRASARGLMAPNKAELQQT